MFVGNDNQMPNEVERTSSSSRALVPIEKKVEKTALRIIAKVLIIGGAICTATIIGAGIGIPFIVAGLILLAIAYAKSPQHKANTAPPRVIVVDKVDKEVSQLENQGPAATTTQPRKYKAKPDPLHAEAESQQVEFGLFLGELQEYIDSGPETSKPVVEHLKIGFVQALLAVTRS